MKKKLTILLSSLTALLLVGCSGKSASSVPSETLSETAQSSSETAESKPEAASEENAASEAVSDAASDDTSKERPTMDDMLIALTFDDGPNTTTTNEVLDKLEKYGVTASFFLIGDNITDASAEAVKRAHDMGCEINNHSKTHSYMTELSPEEIKAEFDFVDAKVVEITGEHTKFFRPPYISVDQEMFDNIGVPFIAGVGCNDWDDKVTVEKRGAAILKQAKDGCIILLHDAEGNSKTVEALDTIIPGLQEKGFKFVTVSELFEIKGIKADGEKVYSNVFQKEQYG